MANINNNKEDLREYGDQELDLRVQNNEYLYRIYTRAVNREKFSRIKDEIDELFVYTDDQLRELEKSFYEEIEEMKKALEEEEEEVDEEEEEEEDKLNPPEDPVPSLVYPRDYNTPENQEIKRKFVEQKVFACVTNLVEWIIGQSLEGFDDRIPFTYDDIENLFCVACPYCESDNISDPKEDEEEFVCLECGKTFRGYNTKGKEVFEWWIVSELLYRELRDAGEVVLSDGLNYYWGRCTTGQAIFLDGIISRICHDMEILKGQKYEWSV